MTDINESYKRHTTLDVMLDALDNFETESAPNREVSQTTAARSSRATCLWP